LCCGIPTPSQVPGKEYVDFPNKDDTGALAKLQNLAWDGGGGIVNSFNWTGTFQSPAGTPIADPGRVVDALANLGDALFDEVIANTAHLLVSATGDPLAPIMVEPIGGCGGGPCPVWATAAQIDQHGVTDLDGLEVWGPETPDGVGQDDSNRISLRGDPLGVAVWACGAPGPCVPRISDAMIAAAIGLSPTVQIDLDALMYKDNGLPDDPTGDELLFSIRPFGPYDGGEVWHWIVGPGPATFLNHGSAKFDCAGNPTGSNAWDTANCVTNLLGNENMDALEAIRMPEPGSLALLALGLLGLAPYVRRRSRK
jgi:hypothetical protein